MNYFPRRLNLFSFLFLCTAALGCQKAATKNMETVSTPPKPTASEVFHLRSECAALAEKLYKEKQDDLTPWMQSKNYSWWHSLDQSSHYDPSSNRCFVELTTRTTDRANTGYEEWSSDLYDGQTKETLAMTRHQTSAGGRKKEEDFGHILADTSSDYPDTYEGTRNFISDKMKENY